MTLLDVVHRCSNPRPWVEGEKIPWNDPDFSRRMLNEHLSQTHDAASRRLEIIDQHVDWIHRHVLKGEPTRILDLGCGPGLYTSRLARLGHNCVGIDFSPASIAYARKQSEADGLDCQYVQGDIRSGDYGNDYGLVMSIFGEFNVFQPEQARAIIRGARDALVPNGLLLLEPHTFDGVATLGRQPASWSSCESGLFSDQPHLLLQENIWDASSKVAIQRYYVVDAVSGTVKSHSSSTQAYTDEDYQSLLAENGFHEVTLYPAMSMGADTVPSVLLAILCRRSVA